MNSARYPLGMLSWLFFAWVEALARHLGVVKTAKSFLDYSTEKWFTSFRLLTLRSLDVSASSGALVSDSLASMSSSRL